MDTTPLRDAYQALLDAAATVAAAGDAVLTAAAGEWNAEEILAHVTIVNAVTIATTATVSAGTISAYDNRLALDTWTIDRAIARCGDTAGLRDRIRAQGQALCALVEHTVTDRELDTQVPTLLLSGGAVMVDQLVPLRDLIAGLADHELPGHTAQLLALVPDIAAAAVSA